MFKIFILVLRLLRKSFLFMLLLMTLLWQKVKKCQKVRLWTLNLWCNKKWRLEVNIKTINVLNFRNRKHKTSWNIWETGIALSSLYFLCLKVCLRSVYICVLLYYTLHVNCHFLLFLKVISFMFCMSIGVYVLTTSPNKWYKIVHMCHKISYANCFFFFLTSELDCYFCFIYFFSILIILSFFLSPMWKCGSQGNIA